jgi:hypothetical protein
MRTAEMHCCRALLQPYIFAGASVTKSLIFRYFLDEGFCQRSFFQISAALMAILVQTYQVFLSLDCDTELQNLSW